MARSIFDGWLKPRSVLHIGAGHGNELDAYRALGVRDIVLVEPEPESVAVLRSRAGGDPRVRIIQAALVRNPGRVRVYAYNQGRLNGLFEPEAYESLWPGLRPLGESVVQGLSADELLALAAPDPADAWLVIECAGIDVRALAAVLAHPDVSFAHVTLRIIPARFGDTGYRQEMLAACKAAGYVNAPAREAPDGLWPAWHFERPASNSAIAMEQAAANRAPSLPVSASWLEGAVSTVDHQNRLLRLLGHGKD